MILCWAFNNHAKRYVFLKQEKVNSQNEDSKVQYLFLPKQREWSRTTGGLSQEFNESYEGCSNIHLGVIRSNMTSKLGFEVFTAHSCFPSGPTLKLSYFPCALPDDVAGGLLAAVLHMQGCSMEIEGLATLAIVKEGGCGEKAGVGRQSRRLFCPTESHYFLEISNHSWRVCAPFDYLQ